MDDLLEAINDYYHNHGHYPKVKVTGSFYFDNVSEIRKLIGTCEVDLITSDETVDQWEME